MESREVEGKIYRRRKCTGCGRLIYTEEREENENLVNYKFTEFKERYKNDKKRNS